MKSSSAPLSPRAPNVDAPLIMPQLRGLLSLLLAALVLAQQAAANVEKTIFLGPQTINVPQQGPTFDNLHLDVLSPAADLAIRTRLQAEFPNSTSGSRGKATWLLLDDLTPGQRYEVRVCWAATQPTAFTLEAYEIPAVWNTPALISSLAEYSSSRIREDEAAGDGNAVGSPDSKPKPNNKPRKTRPSPGSKERHASMLLLQILAAADYYTDNQTLMSNVAPVHVDIILDPFIMNILPQSLAPTVGYVLFIATVFWFVAQRTAAWVQKLAVDGSRQLSSKKDQ
ncbi:hypothetical protein MAPG_10066 [Magnaporthiopsis poae ATCC 64411]|uniref:Uncharacterized protein n=1 Tax=Magnaporthiopsis poae (strain ATCC 64411 / 73-15) TaxID=644358 RepID=A0A0C4EBL4_MAGP6|nr:hypothetical protein MAPG_10066 [Magnaporthiopsis poae ATCC 64411]